MRPITWHNRFTPKVSRWSFRHAPGVGLHGPQTMEVAVLPADAPIREPGEIRQSPNGDGTGRPRTFTPE
ncbi:hypothetical protein ABZ912_60050 [Nonomuraea angiospora]|uniref:hypothetical protein n=1 Tax=Nonomuraea angiospora TaxID=46172 RepID=UPI0033E56B5C